MNPRPHSLAIREIVELFVVFYMLLFVSMYKLFKLPFAPVCFVAISV